MIVFNIDEDDNWFIGEDKFLEIDVFQANKRTTQDTTGWTMSWMLKRALSDLDGDALLTKSVAFPSNGVARVSVTSTNTITLDPGRYYQEWLRTDQNERTVISQGRAVLRRGVHRS